MEQIQGGPGSGKTRALAQRIAGLLNDGVAAPAEIVALTFTHNACESLRAHVAEHLADRSLAPQLSIKTFHMFCSALIAQHGARVGLSAAWRMTDFVDAHNARLLPPALAGVLLDSTQIYSFAAALRLGTRIVALPDVAAQFRHVFVDEFQDCDRAQFELVCALVAANPAAQLTAVGDPNQEIYSFLTDHLPNAFECMRQRFPATKVSRLLVNHRSSASVVTHCNRILPPPMHPRAGAPEGRVAAVEDSPDALVQLITDLSSSSSSSSSYAPGDIALLLRTNAEVQRFTRLLAARGVPVNPGLGLRAAAVQPLPNFAITLLKFSLSGNGAHLLQLLHNHTAKHVPRSALERLAASGLSLETVRAAATDPQYVDFLLGLRHELAGATTENEVLRILSAAVPARGRQQRKAAPTRSVVGATPAQIAGWRAFLSLLSPPEVPDPAEVSHAGDALPPGEAAHTVLRRIFSYEQEPTVSSKVSVLTMHAAKSKQWPVVLAAYKPPVWGRPNADEERRLKYVAASRAMRELYLVGGMQTSATAVVPGIAPRGTARGIGYEEALARDPLVFGKISAKRILARTVKL